MKVLGIIPARYQSTRFPGKLLATLMNKPILQHTFESAQKSSCLDSLFVATDDIRIKNLIQSLGGKTILTSENCKNGTERIVEAFEKDPFLQEHDIIINLQGDHPFISDEIIQSLILLLKNDRQAEVATVAVPFQDPTKVSLPQFVKSVFDQNYNALYFSRSKIPSGGNDHYQHVGIYAYRKTFLQNYRKLKESSLAKAEDLEQLQFLDNGLKIKVTLVNETSHSVDTPEDLKELEDLLCR